jgi:hypothetical protein
VKFEGGPALRDFSLRRKFLEQAIGKEVIVMEFKKGNGNHEKTGKVDERIVNA